MSLTRSIETYMKYKLIVCFFVEVYLIIIAILKVHLIDEYNAYGNVDTYASCIEVTLLYVCS